MSKAQVRNKLRKLLSTVKASKLQDWINEASELSPEFSTALEGIYCGREGRIHTELCQGIFITMGWNTVATQKVEFAYVS